MSAPAISVLLPVYNGEAYLREAVDSVLGQSFADFELIAIDDGSADGSLAILRSYDDPRLRIVTRENRGLVATLNEGLLLAEAELVARMDADDAMLPERLERQKAYMDAHPGCVALGSAVTFIDGEGRVGATATYPAGDELARRMREEGSMLAHPSVMLRREAALDAGGYRAAFAHCEDYDLWLRLLEHGGIANLEEPLLRYRQHGGQVSAKHAVAQAVGTATAQEMARLRASGGEPEWDAQVPLAPERLASLKLPSGALADIHEAGLRACLRPGLLASAEGRQAMLALIRGIVRTQPKRLTDYAMQHLLWALAASCWGQGGRKEGALLAATAIFHAPLRSLRTLLAKLRHGAWRMKSSIFGA